MCMCHMSNLTCMQTIRNLHILKDCNEKAIVGLCRPDVATDQDLHCLSHILSHITLNGVNLDQIL